MNRCYHCEACCQGRFPARGGKENIHDRKSPVPNRVCGNEGDDDDYEVNDGLHDTLSRSMASLPPWAKGGTCSLRQVEADS